MRIFQVYGSIYSTVEKRDAQNVSSGPDQMKTSKVVNKKRKGFADKRESRILELLIQSQPFDWLLLKVGEKKKTN